jgi:hypothetical protein
LLYWQEKEGSELSCSLHFIGPGAKIKRNAELLPDRSGNLLAIKSIITLFFRADGGSRILVNGH